MSHSVIQYQSPETKVRTEDVQTKLSDVTPGDTFRLPTIPFAEAMDKPGQSFFRVVKPAEALKDGRVRATSYDGLITRELDGDRMVIVHDIVTQIKPAATKEIKEVIPADNSDRA